MHHNRCCNILDPVDHMNNLGMSVARNNLNVIAAAILKGHQNLEEILPQFARLSHSPPTAIITPVPTFASESAHFKPALPPPTDPALARQKWGFLSQFFPSCYKIHLRDYVNHVSRDCRGVAGSSSEALVGDVTSMWVAHLFSVTTSKDSEVYMPNTTFM